MQHALTLWPHPAYLTIASAVAGAVAREAEHRKQMKYSHLEDSHYFVPIAIETLDALGHKARCFLKELAQCISLATEDNLAHHHLIQCLSVAVQRGNAAAVLGCIGVQGFIQRGGALGFSPPLTCFPSLKYFKELIFLNCITKESLHYSH